MLALGREALVDEDWDKAESYADRLIAMDQRDHGRLLRGEMLFKQHRPESAFDALNKVRATLRVDAARTRVAHVELAMAPGRPAARHVLQERPNDPDARTADGGDRVQPGMAARRRLPGVRNWPRRTAGPL